MEGGQRQDPALRTGLRHGVVHLPVLVAHRRRRCARVVEEIVTRRLFRPAAQIFDLVDAVERSPDDAGILSGLDLLLEPVTLGPAAISTKVGSQSRAANSWFLTVPGLMTPGQRTTSGAR